MNSRKRMLQLVECSEVDSSGGAQAQPSHSHSTTNRRSAHSMANQLLTLRFLSVLLIGAFGDPQPGRIPKVYNALITSNQNLEPSKAYPVYQPVIQDAFVFPFQPAVFYGTELGINNGLFPAAAADPKDAQAPQPAPSSTPEPQTEAAPSSTEAPPSSTLAPEPSSAEPNNPTPTPPLPPNIQSPIPLNQFGLPPQVLPLNVLDSAYNGFTQVGPFTYSYPNIRFYDPFDPFSLSPYSNLPLIRHVPNFLGQGISTFPGKLALVSNGAAVTSTEAPGSAQTPPPEPSDLNVLNYSSKDPAIPDVPPPPLPQGGLKSDKAE
ncbi:hypothetical protein K1T71_001782 [Dendrolimus kikuchii]|uniref:Uncharacterized protein n=1 Tax=Dendrolimus kikuchii TaxID=765133 RepID=A0ACC1DFJ2_9NEOP|nr:hypothetical protein K1T71_001782 [Dendrolimus kikuchii]